MKRRIAFLLVFVLLITFVSMSVSAEQADGSDRAYVQEQGGLAEDELGMTNEDIVNEVLADPSISEEAKQQVIEKMGDTTDMPTPRAGNLMALTGYMQETKDWCSAATIQQTLKKANGNKGSSQQTVMNAVGAGPSLQRVLDYLNSKQSKCNYVRRAVTSQTDLNSKLTWSYSYGSPMVFTMKSPDKTYWPYITGGHFTNLAGQRSDGTYMVYDPYYYVHYIGTGTGFHNRSFNEIWTVNGYLFGSEGHVIGF